MITNHNSIKETWLDVNGMHIHCYLSGNHGKPVILLHGGGVDSARLSWEPVIDRLGETFRVFAPDLPGYGQSDKPDVTYSVDYYTDFLHGLMDALGLEKASLIGISLGGGIALNFTLNYPKRVEHLIPVDPYGLTSRYMLHHISWVYVHTFLNEWSYSLYKNRKTAEKLIRASGIFHHPELITPDLMDDLYAAATAPDAGKAFTSLQRSEFGWKRVRTDLTGRLHQITVPTLFIQGEMDKAVPLYAAKRAAGLVPGAELHIMAECGHWANRENPDEFLEYVKEFLSR